MWLVCATILSVVPLGIFRKVETHQAFSFLHLSRPQTDVMSGRIGTRLLHPVNPPPPVPGNRRSPQLKRG